jgi:isoamyl acetate esterase
MQLDRDFETTRKYARAVKEVAAETGVGLVDVWTDLWTAAGEKEEKLSQYLYDGLHPNKAGYKVRNNAPKNINNKNQLGDIDNV